MEDQAAQYIHEILAVKRLRQHGVGAPFVGEFEVSVRHDGAGFRSEEHTSELQSRP